MRCWNHEEGLTQFSPSGETSTGQAAEASPRLCSCYFYFAPLQVLIFVVITLPEHEVWGGGRGRKREGRALFHPPCRWRIDGARAASQDSLASPRSGGMERGGALARGGEEPDRNIDCPFNVIWHQRKWKQRTRRENCNLNAPLGDSVEWIGGFALPEMSLWDPF